jgi:hypothetical protein
MAKTKEKEEDEEETEEGVGIDPETIAVLEDQVKKGKARKFILIYRGATIKKLIVFKKGPFNVLVQKAKKDGYRGDVVCGIVTGSGVNLNFQLAGNKEVADAMSVDRVADGEPTKTTKLKEFFSDNGMKRIPTYEIIQDVNKLGKPDEDEAESTNGAAAPAVQEGAKATDGAATGDMEAKCKQLLAALSPKIKEAAAAAPDKQSEITGLLKSALAQQGKGAWSEAFETLKKLVAAVKEALSQTPAKAPAIDQAGDDDTPTTTATPASGGTTTATTATATTGTTATPPTPSTPAPPTTPAKSAEEEAYEKELTEINALVDALNKHAHKLHISGELTTITTELGKGDTDFKAKKYTDAMADLKKARDTAVKAKGFADKFEEYSKKRAKAQFLVTAFKDLLPTRKLATDAATTMDNQLQAMTDADNLAKPPSRDYAGATMKVAGVTIKLKGMVTSWYVTPNTPRIQTLKTGATNTFLDKQIKAVEAEMAILNANISAEDYRKALLQGPKVDRLLDAAEAASTRRTAFDTERVKTVAAIDTLKPFPALAPQMDSLNKRLKGADDQASIESREFENAVETLKKIEEDAKALATNGPAAEAYAKDRPVAEKAYSDLAKHKRAAAQRSLLEGIKTKLDKAATLAKFPQTVAAANDELKLAKQEIDSATKVLGAVDSVDLAADGAKDADSAKKALDTLKVSISEAKKDKHAGEFTKEFKSIDDKVAAAEKKLAEPKTAADAIKDIKSIGAELSKLMIQLTQQDGYVAERAAVEARLKKVKELPEAKAIQTNITPVETALKDAETQDKAHAFDKRAAAMEKARGAADVAERTAAQCKTYNDRQKALETEVTASTLDAADKKKVTDAIKLASGRATVLKYDEATKLLVEAESTYETLLINGYAKQATPDLTKIAAAAKRMMKNGCGKDIDKLIQKLPDTTKHDVLKTLAKERFGIELKTDADTETRSAKAMLNMLAKVPDDVVGNVSLKTVERREPDKNGGFYRSSEQLVVMNGRPGQSTQGFGATISKELPGDVYANCQPKDASSVDYFDFATLHELGHSVDDNLQFMASREGKAEFANWKTYGGNIDPIVDAVADWTKYNSTPEQKKAISDLIQGNEVTWPTPPADKTAAWNDAKKKVTDWHKLANVTHKVWWKQADINKIDVNGTVYQEAYERNWVSYDTAARKKGLTGYQFRAPGEWFAELYAAYRMDKLQSSHPAVKWLSKLKV